MTAGRLRSAAAALVVLGAGAEWAALQRTQLQAAATPADWRRAVVDLVAGWTIAGCGLAAWHLRSDRRLGPLLTAAGALWFLGTLADSGVGWVADAGGALVLLHRGPLVHALLSYPDDHRRGRLWWAALVTGYTTAAVSQLGDSTAGAIVLAGLLVAAIAHRLSLAAVRERRALRPAIAVAIAFGAVIVTAAIVRPDSNGRDALLAGYDAVVGAGAAWLLADLLRARWTESAVTGLVVGLGRDPGSVPLERRLAQVLGTPSVRLGYRLPGRGGFVDGAGQELDLAQASPERAVTLLGGPEPIAALVHDRGAVEDPILLDSVAAAARIAVSNAQLQSTVRARLEELEASRRRIVEAADAQRRRFERELRAGPQEQLGDVARTLAACRECDEETGFTALLDETLREVDGALAELSDFARGVHPRQLSEGGLAPALLELGRRSPLPVDVRATAQRFSPALEAAVYFACAEAVTNAGKHASASQIAVSVELVNGRLVATVADDGVGGARLDAGSGLRGLRDRVEALRGVLVLESPAGQGTRLQVVLPVRS